MEPGSDGRGAPHPASAGSVAVDGAHLVVDAHHHVWDLSVRDQPWTEGLPVLRRSFGMAELVPQLVRNGVHGTVLVQTVTVAQESPELLEVAGRHPEVLGVVGWVDLTGPDVADELSRLRSLPGGDRLVGVRHQVQEEPDPRWLLREDVLRGLRAVAAAGLVYDLLVVRSQLDAAVAVTRALPELRFVLDHAGKPGIAEGELDPWRSQITDLAGGANVSAKLSGLLTEAAPSWSPADLRPYSDHLLECFGPDRVMAGSDWPVCLLRADYDRTTAVTRELLSGLSDVERRSVLGGTAVQAYGLAAAVRA
jgi:L-fuconolactonase